jgi:hypothetical protein
MVSGWDRCDGCRLRWRDYATVLRPKLIAAKQRLDRPA